MHLKELIAYFEGAKISYPVKLSKHETILNDMFIRSQIEYLVRNPKNATYLPYYDDCIDYIY